MLKSNLKFPVQFQNYAVYGDPVALAWLKVNVDDNRSVRDVIRLSKDYDGWKALKHSDDIAKYVREAYSMSRPCNFFDLCIQKGDAEYDMSASRYDVDSASCTCRPIKGAEKALRSDCQERLNEAAKALVERKNSGVYANLWQVAYEKVNMDAEAVFAGIPDRLANPDKYTWYGAAPAPAEPKPARVAPNPQVQVVEHKETIIERTVEKQTPLEDMLQKTVCEMVARVAIDDMVPRIRERIVEEFGVEPQRHEIKIADLEPATVNGIMHEQFDKVAFFIANKVPVYLYGPAGSGKNHMVEQIAEAMKLDFYTSNSVTEEFKFNGFLDIHGRYQESEFYKAFTRGGIFFLDELDASCPEVLVNLNAAIANGYFPFPNGTKRAHENFRVVAAGNTLGTGADASYTGRTQLDAATLNRFIVIPVDYDERIDLLSANGDKELADFAKGYRAAAKKCGLATICSYRNIKMIKVAEQSMDIADALLFALTKEMNKDDINTIIAQFPVANRNNKYYNKLSEVKPMC